MNVRQAYFAAGAAVVQTAHVIAAPTPANVIFALAFIGMMLACTFAH